MDNASRILLALDNHLQQPTNLVLYGRAAIYLGFEGAPQDLASSHDVDVIIPIGQLDSYNEAFWDAQERTNLMLLDAGLYITHLFRSDQVFLRSSWEQHLQPIHRPSTRFLRLFRPATPDLILTKMMRGTDAQDLADIRFMVQQDKVTASELEAAFSEAVIPEIMELREAFNTAQPLVRQIVQEARC